MKAEQQIKALAELDGWTLAIQKGNIYGVAFRERDAFNKPMWQDELPPYLTSYDAIIPLIQKQSREVKADVWYRIGSVTWGWLDETPYQLCEALLRATGKWIE